MLMTAFQPEQGWRKPGQQQQHPREGSSPDPTPIQFSGASGANGQKNEPSSTKKIFLHLKTCKKLTLFLNWIASNLKISKEIS